jgi:hypothetical protein
MGQAGVAGLIILNLEIVSCSRDLLFSSVVLLLAWLLGGNRL